MSTIFHKTTMFGGTNDSLDGIPNYNLISADIAFVVSLDTTFTYTFDATSVTAESIPDVVAPDFGKPIGRWILCA
jgi:hypothetical protein